MKLKTKFTIIVSILISVFSLIALFAFAHYKKSIKGTVVQQQFLMISTLADEIDNKLLTAQQSLLAVAKAAPPDIMRHPGKAQAFLDSRMVLHTIFDNNVFILTPSGKLFVESPEVAGRRGLDLSLREFISNTLKTEKPYISDPYVSMKPPKHPAILLTVPLFDGKGNITGILGGSIDLFRDNFLGRLRTVKIGETGYLILTTADRTLIMHPDKRRIMTKQAPGVNRLYDKAIEGFEGTGENITSYGVKMLTSYKRMKAKNWILLGSYPQAEAYRPIQIAERYFLIIAVTGIVAAFFVISFITKYLIKPLEVFTRHVEEIPQKTGDERFLNIKTGDEIETLSRAFNKMVNEIDLRSALQRSEESLRESEKFLQAVIETEPECVKLLDANGALLQMNRAGLDMIQAESLEQVKGRCVAGLVVPEHRAAFDSLRERVFLGESGMLEFETIGLKGKHLWLETHAVPLRNDKEEIVALLGVTRDVTERKMAQNELAEEKERLAVTLRSIGDGVIVTDTGGAITLINRVAEELTGWHGEEAMGRPLPVVFNIINEGTRLPCKSPVDDVLDRGLIVGLANHTALIRRDGTEIIIADSAAPIRDRCSNIIGVVLVFRDITARYRMDAEMQKMQKLESLGVLAGGLAHDFNNLLTGIMGNISIVKMHIDPDHTDYARLSAADKAVERATDLTQQLLTFAKGGAPIKKAISIAQLARESVEFALSGSSIGCNYTIPDDLWNAEVDSGQLAQVFNNLSINAIHAMPEGGMVSVSMENVTLPVNMVPTLPAGDYLKIVYSDSGTGIPEEHLPKIFDPYFTTKQSGSGLGLATVFSIIRKHDGHITVESGVGAGTRFTIYLPATKDTGGSRSSIKDSLNVGHGKVLVMDDEDLVRNVAGEMLAALGYNVLFAEDGEKAISMYKEAFGEKNPFDAVIMDLTIPGGMGGREAVWKILEIDPEAKVIASSGYSTDPVMSEYRKYGFSGVMTKPYRIEQMSETIAGVMSL